MSLGVICSSFPYLPRCSGDTNPDSPAISICHINYSDGLHQDPREALSFLSMGLAKQLHQLRRSPRYMSQPVFKALLEGMLLFEGRDLTCLTEKQGQQIRQIWSI